MEIIKHGNHPEKLFFKCGNCNCIFTAYPDECKTEESFGDVYFYATCPESFCKFPRCIEIYADNKELLEILKNN